MSYAWVIGLLRKDLFKDLPGLSLLCVSLVGWRCRSVERQRVEDRGFSIVRVLTMDLLHRFFVRKGAGSVFELVRVLVEDLYRRNIGAFTIRFGADRFRLFNGIGSFLQCRLTWWHPQRIVDAHGDSPVGHGATRVRLRNTGKHPERLLIPKGV